MYLLDWQRYCFVVQRHVQPMCCAIIQRTCIQAWVPNNVWSMELSRIRTTQSNSLPFVESTLQNNFGNTMYCLWKDRTTSHQKNVKSQMQAKSVHEPPESAILKSATLRSIFQWLAVHRVTGIYKDPQCWDPHSHITPLLLPKEKIYGKIMGMEVPSLRVTINSMYLEISVNSMCRAVCLISKFNNDFAPWNQRQTITGSFQLFKRN